MSPFQRQLMRTQAPQVLRDPPVSRALRHGVAASTEHEAIPLRADFRRVIDVGANRGQCALYAARSFPAAQLICFEPLPRARALLNRIVDAQARLRVFDVALSAYDGAADFYVSNSDDSSSLLPIGPRQRTAFPGTDEQTTISVTIRKLDDILDPTNLAKPVLIKIDVQGGELGTLQGAGRVLGSVDAILVEASFVELYSGQALADEVWGFLRGRGFSCRRIWSVTYGPEGERLQGDFLFSREGFDPLTS